jgi:hypothetical protein
MSTLYHVSQGHVERVIPEATTSRRVKINGSWYPRSEFFATADDAAEAAQPIVEQLRRQAAAMETQARRLSRRSL